MDSYRALGQSPFERAFIRQHQAALLRTHQGRKRRPAVTPLTDYAERPVEFARDILDVELWEAQRWILEAVSQHPRVTVSTCFAAGKTFSAAVLTLWWLYTRRPALVVTTAPTMRQVRNLLWRDIRKLCAKARTRIQGRLLQSRLELADDWLAFGFASDRPDAVQGLHEAENVLFIEDEASGMTPEILEGFEGITTTPNSRHLKIGNPISNSGPFFESHCHPEESLRWVRHTVSALDIVEANLPIRGLVTREWVDDKRERWLNRGLTHLWETRVLGRFSLSSPESIVPVAWILAAQERWHLVDGDGVRELGVDVAGGGQDETVIYLRTGRRVEYLASWQTEDLMWSAETIAALAAEEEVSRISVDRTGLGQGVWSRLVQMQAEEGLLKDVSIIGVALQAGPREPDVYAKRQDEVMFNLRWALNPENPAAIAIHPADKILAEELSLRGWRKTERGLISCEGKRELRRRGLGSPDRADAVSLLFAEERRTMEGARPRPGYMIL